MQKETFLSTEGDSWFRRNKDKSGEREEVAVDTLIGWLGAHAENIDRILEIGSGAGEKLALLCQALKASGVGVEPSSEAVAHAQKSHMGDLEFRVGVADQISDRDGAYDFVHFGFCLYLLDRADILKALAEADRLLRPGGFISVLDFDPSQMHRRPYSHQPGIFSYKADYTAPLLASGHFSLVGKHSFSHYGPAFHPDPNERVAIWLLYKEPEAYPTVE